MAVEDRTMTHTRQKFSFPGHDGHELAARLDLPAGAIRSYVLFAHCFTCSQDIQAARRIAQALAGEGFAVVRFDFTGLGSSGGEFANTHFSSNIADLVAAADHMRRHLAAPTVLVGHSLGGAAVLAAAGQIPEVRAIATIGAPADPAHVLHNLGAALAEVEAEGGADVTLGGRTFTIKDTFVEDVKAFNLEAKIATLRCPLLILHAPRDDIVGIDNATRIFTAAKHPKSFVSLDDADHLLSRPEDGDDAARMIAAWAARYVARPAKAAQPPEDRIIVRETGQGKFQTAVAARNHLMIADEPASVGGLDSGPSPYEFVAVALGACTVMTLRMYADRKQLALGRISVEVRHGKVAASHCDDCGSTVEGRSGRIDRFERVIRVEGGAPDDLHPKLLEIADKCPVHRTLHSGAAIVTRVGSEDDS